MEKIDEKTKEVIDASIKEAVSDVKKEQDALKEKQEKETADKLAVEKATKEAVEKQVKDAIEKEIKPSFAYQPPRFNFHKGAEDDSKFSYVKLIKAMASGDWSRASVEKSAIEKTAGTFPEAGIYGPASSTTAGGYMIPPTYSRELIDILTTQSVVRKAGATVYPMDGDIMYLPKMTAGATTHWGPTTEGTALTGDTTTAFTQVTITAKKLYCLVGVANQLLRSSSPAVESIVRNDIMRQIALAEDLAMLYVQSGAPLGLMYTHSNGYATYGNGTTTALLAGTNYLYAGGNGTTPVVGGGKPTFDDVLDSMYKVQASNSKVTGFIAHPRTKNTLRKIQGTDGQYIYTVPTDSKIPDNMYGLPVHLTTQVGITFDDATNSGVANLSYMLCGDWSEFVIGQHESLELAVSEHAGFYSDTTWLRATLWEGWALKHEPAFCAVLDIAA